MGRRPATLKLSFIQAFTDKTGRRRHYFRRAGKRVPLPGLPGSSEFMEAYAAALADEPAKPVKRATVAAGSVADLVQRYYASPSFLRLSAGSKRDYARILDSFAAAHGHRRVDQLTREVVDVLIGKMADRPGAGIKLLKRIRTLVRYGLQIGWIDRDPTLGATSYKSREIHTWTEEEIAAFESRWPSGSRQRLAFALLLYTGQRGSDVHRMVWTDVAGDTIRVSQQKTGEKLVIPLHPDLQAELSRASRATVAILSTAVGRPFSVKGFGNMASNAIAAADLPPRCKAHGLRKAAARRLAEAGATSKQIAAVTGHRTLSEIERYTRAAEQAELARQAIDRQTGARERKAISIVKPDPKV